MVRDWSPPPQQEVVRFNVGVDNMDAVQFLNHVQDAGGKIHDERLRHHFIAQAFVDVHRVLREEKMSVQRNRQYDVSKSLWVLEWSYQQGAIVVQLS